MYHCHFEDVEHVQMGMTGMVYVRPKQNKIAIAGNPAGTKYAYNDGDGSTRYDREFSFMLTELWSAAHYRDAHIQVSDWTDYDASFWLMNGRGYPDTLAPNSDPLVPPSDPRLQYQPISSLVHCNAGEKVLLRMANLGFQNHAMTVDNVDLTMIAKDASLLRGRNGEAQLRPHQHRRDRSRREPRRALHRTVARRVPALRPHLRLRQQRGRRRVRRDGDADPRRARRDARPPVRPERVRSQESR